MAIQEQNHGDEDDISRIRIIKQKINRTIENLSIRTRRRVGRRVALRTE